MSLHAQDGEWKEISMEEVAELEKATEAIFLELEGKEHIEKGETRWKVVSDDYFTYKENTAAVVDMFGKDFPVEGYEQFKNYTAEGLHGPFSDSSSVFFLEFKSRETVPNVNFYHMAVSIISAADTTDFNKQMKTLQKKCIKQKINMYEAFQTLELDYETHIFQNNPFLNFNPKDLLPIILEELKEMELYEIRVSRKDIEAPRKFYFAYFQKLDEVMEFEELTFNRINVIEIKN